MAKYIDADRLRAEIERLKETHERNLDKPMERGRIGHAHGYVDCCDEFLAFIDSLQQEQSEVDLKKIIEQTYHDGSVADTDDMDHATYENIARHFFELGQRDAANKYDEIEYNRQREEEEMSDKTLEEAAIAYLLNEHRSPLNRLMHQVGVKVEMSYHKDIEAAFKAGAKWMAGQGVSLEDQMTYYDGFLLYGKDERAFTMEGNFNEGDKVIVQIRKKEESK